MDGEQALEAQTDGGNEPRFEIDLATETPPAAGTGAAEGALPFSAASPPAGPPQQDLIQQELMQARRELQELRGAVWPYLQHQQQQLAQQDRPPKTLEDLKTDPNTTVEDLVSFIDWNNNQRLREIQATTEMAAQRAMSEQRLRGMLSEQAVGQGYDYDSVVERHIRPLYQQNPNLRALFQAAFPTDPAMGEYLGGLLIDMGNRFKGDLPATVRAINSAGAAFQSGAQQVTQNIKQQAAAGAQRVLPAAGAGGLGRTRKLGADDIWNLSDDEFRRLDHQLTGM